jgi:serine/threonine-protein kinase RsbT
MVGCQKSNASRYFRRNNMGTERRIYINNDLDIVVVRMQAREMAKQMGFGTADQARISLAASELARVLSWNTDNAGEIIMSDANQNGQHGLQVACVVNLELVSTGDEAAAPQGNRSLAGASQLVDESIVEEQGDNQAQVTLIKWLK